jgi:predicted CXXCH cytochrome family protein
VVKIGKVLALGALLGASAFAGYEAVTRPVGNRELIIVATGGIRARVRHCGCQGDVKATFPNGLPRIVTCTCHGSPVMPKMDEPLELGGFPERSALLRAWKTRDPLVLDSGDLLFPGLAPEDFERPEWQLRAQLLVELSEDLGVEALAVGDDDLALGRGLLEGLAKKSRIAFLSANLRDAKTHAPLFASRVRLVHAGVKVGVVGVLAPPPSEAFTALLAREGLELGDAAQAARAEVAQLKIEGCEVVVLLGHAPDQTLRAIARSAPGVDVVIGAHPEVPTDAKEEIEDGVAFTTPFPGGGAPLDILLDVVAGAHGVEDAPTIQEATVWIQRLQGQLAKQREAGDSAEKLHATEMEIRAREALLSKEPRHGLTAKAVPLLAHLWKKGHDPAVLAAIDRYKDDVVKIALDPQVVSKLEAPLALPSGVPTGFATEQTCAACHKAQVETWTHSRHARAWASLEKSGSDKDPECVRCHSIGFRQPGGFAEVRRARHDGLDYTNVQCEACHSPRSAHPANPNVGIRIPTTQVCVRCHDPERDPRFSEAKLAEALKGATPICVRGLPR